MPSKKSGIQFYADECFPLTTAIYLRLVGYSIKHASEYNFLNKSDIAHLKFAKNKEKILITLDRDFLGYTTERAKGTKGIVVVTTGSNAPKHINRICKKQLPKIKRRFIADSVVLISNDRVTKNK